MATVWAQGRFYVAEPTSDAREECRDCGFDAVFRFPITLILDTGVMPFGELKACARCYAEDS